jgi:hypothetical protein
MGLASESIAASLGADLATTTVHADALPLPTELGGTDIKVKDSVATSAPLPSSSSLPHRSITKFRRGRQRASRV